MMIKKKKDSFNDYQVELSWGQLNAAYRALERDHSDPLADEMFAELGWYLQNVPGPGEDEEEYKAAREAEKQAVEAGEGGAAPGSEEMLGTELEEPPGQQSELRGTEGGEMETGEPMPGEEGPVGPAGPEAPPRYDERPEAEEADQYLERPPAMA